MILEYLYLTEGEYWSVRGETRPRPLCLPQIQHERDWNWNLESALRAPQLTIPVYRLVCIMGH